MPHSHLPRVRLRRKLTARHTRDGTKAADAETLERDDPLSEFPAEDPLATVGVTGTRAVSVRRRAVTWLAFVSAAAKRRFKGVLSRAAALFCQLVDARRQATSVSAQWRRRMSRP